MKVIYVVYANYDYEGHFVVGIAATKRRAQKIYEEATSGDSVDLDKYTLQKDGSFKHKETVSSRKPKRGW